MRVPCPASRRTSPSSCRPSARRSTGRRPIRACARSRTWARWRSGDASACGSASASPTWRTCSRRARTSSCRSGSRVTTSRRPSAGTPSTTAWPGRRRPAPATCCCTTTRARRPRACVSGGSCAAAWAYSPRRWPTRRARQGCEIRCDAEVEQVVTRGGRAVGVRLASGEEIAARRVLSNADPKRTFLSLCERRPPSDFIARIEAYRCMGTSMKINLAVSELPFAKGLPEDGVQPYHTGIMELNPFIADMDFQQAQARQGIAADPAHIELCFPTVHDPSLAPEGKHIITIDVNSQPYRLRDAEWDDIKEDRADRAISTIAEHFPKLPDLIEHRQLVTPLDMERLMGLTGGHYTATWRPTSCCSCGRFGGGPTTHTDPRALPVRCRHASRRRGDRGERTERGARGPAGRARRTEIGGNHGTTATPLHDAGHRTAGLLEGHGGRRGGGGCRAGHRGARDGAQLVGAGRGVEAARGIGRRRARRGGPRARCPRGSRTRRSACSDPRCGTAFPPRSTTGWACSPTDRGCASSATMSSGTGTTSSVAPSSAGRARRTTARSRLHDDPRA